MYDMPDSPFEYLIELIASDNTIVDLLSDIPEVKFRERMKGKNLEELDSFLDHIVQEIDKQIESHKKRYKNSQGEYIVKAYHNRGVIGDLVMFRDHIINIKGNEIDQAEKKKLFLTYTELLVKENKAIFSRSLRQETLLVFFQIVLEKCKESSAESLAQTLDEIKSLEKFNKTNGQKLSRAKASVKKGPDMKFGYKIEESLENYIKELIKLDDHQALYDFIIENDLPNRLTKGHLDNYCIVINNFVEIFQQKKENDTALEKLKDQPAVKVYLEREKTLVEDTAGVDAQKEYLKSTIDNILELINTQRTELNEIKSEYEKQKSKSKPNSKSLAFFERESKQSGAALNILDEFEAEVKRIQEDVDNCKTGRDILKKSEQLFNLTSACSNSPTLNEARFKERSLLQRLFRWIFVDVHTTVQRLSLVNQLKDISTTMSLEVSYFTDSNKAIQIASDKAIELMAIEKKIEGLRKNEVKNREKIESLEKEKQDLSKNYPRAKAIYDKTIEFDPKYQDAKKAPFEMSSGGIAARGAGLVAGALSAYPLVILAVALAPIALPVLGLGALTVTTIKLTLGSRQED